MCLHNQLDILGLAQGGGNMPHIIVPELFCWECNKGISLPICCPIDERYGEEELITKWMFAKGFEIEPFGVYAIMEFFYPTEDPEGQEIFKPFVNIIDFYKEPDLRLMDVWALGKASDDLEDLIGFNIINEKLFNKHMKGIIDVKKN